MPTIFESYNNLKKDLTSFGVEDSLFEAKQIIKTVTGLDNAGIIANYTRNLTEFEEVNLKAITVQRKIGYPLQYILGHWDFYGRRFKVGVGVLIPRQDTETVIEVCLDLLKTKQNPEILDLCAGTGCIGITLACEKEDAMVVLLEKYMEAARYTRENIASLSPLNATLVMGDVLEGDYNERKYDLIVSNPPYVTADEMKHLQKELTHEPETALFGGEDGLDFYRAIVKNYKNSLTENGALVLEIGSTQGPAVSEILEKNGFGNVKLKKDLAGFDRVVFGTVNALK